MPVITGTSVKGYQRLFGAVSLTVARFDLAFPSTPAIDVARIGYGYVVGRAPTTPFQFYVVNSIRVYQPGTVFLWLPLSNTPAWSWRIDVDWNEAGIPWSIRYD